MMPGDPCRFQSNVVFWTSPDVYANEFISSRTRVYVDPVAPLVGLVLCVLPASFSEARPTLVLVAGRLAWTRLKSLLSTQSFPRAVIARALLQNAREQDP